MTHELVQILESKGIVYRKSNNPHEIILFCTSGEHEDNHPSLSFNLQKQLFQCWACGFKGGTSKFLASIGVHTPLNTAKNDISVKTSILLDRIGRIQRASTSLALPEEMEPFHYPYRMLSPDIMKESQSDPLEASCSTLEKTLSTQSKCISVAQANLIFTYPSNGRRHTKIELYSSCIGINPTFGADRNWTNSASMRKAVTICAR